MKTAELYFMKRTLITAETKRVAAFLAKLLRRNDRKQVALIKALEETASGRLRRLSIFDQWIDYEKGGLAHLAALAMRDANGTRSYMMQACNHATGKRLRRSERSRLAELLQQRHDLIITLIW